MLPGTEKVTESKLKKNGPKRKMRRLKKKEGVVHVVWFVKYQ